MKWLLLVMLCCLGTGQVWAQEDVPVGGTYTLTSNWGTTQPDGKVVFTNFTYANRYYSHKYDQYVFLNFELFDLKSICIDSFRLSASYGVYDGVLSCKLPYINLNITLSDTINCFYSFGEYSNNEYISSIDSKNWVAILLNNDTLRAYDKNHSRRYFICDDLRIYRGSQEYILRPANYDIIDWNDIKRLVDELKELGEY